MTKHFETIPDAGRIALVSYSMWGLYAAFILTNASDAIYYYFGIDTSPSVWSVLLNVAIVAAIVGRLIQQTSEGAWRRRALIAVAVVVLALWAVPSLAMEPWSEDKVAIVPVEPEPVPPTQPGAGPTYAQTSEHLTPLVSKWEGKHACPNSRTLHCSYLDTIASPPLWTVCFGHTKTALPGQRFSDDHCMGLLATDLKSYWAGVREGFSPETIAQRLTAERDAAFASLGYNVGISGVRGSTATRRMNNGDIAGGCEALTWWNKAGGRVVRGLVNRRSEERDLCMQGLST